MSDEEGRQLCVFVGARVREIVEQIVDPMRRFRAWQKWRQETSAAVDWVDVGSFGDTRYMPGMVIDLGELRVLASRWSDHPITPITPETAMSSRESLEAAEREWEQRAGEQWGRVNRAEAEVKKLRAALERIADLRSSLKAIQTWSYDEQAWKCAGDALDVDDRATLKESS